MLLRLILDPPAAGDWNMAVDEMMLETVATSGQPVMRFYAWQEPTLSLGYFQSLQDRRQHLASMACPVVRRSTGGGAIVHDQEITYSIALPLADRWSSAAAELYDVFHAGLIAVLAQCGVCAALCEKTLHPLEGEPFLCFERRAKGDVLLDSHKIAGSAQRRRRGAILQHGSVLLDRSRAAPGLLGIAQIAGKRLTAEELIAGWSRKIAISLGVTLLPSAWTAAEIELAETVLSTRFASPDWLQRRDSR